MKLYIYDHCPYCVKARMIFGIKNQPVQIITLLNDDEKTPISMIGKKMLPILEKKAAEYMPESLDIIKYVDENTAPVKVLWEEDSSLINILSESRLCYYSLTMPRWVNSRMEEFKTPSAKKYFQEKKEQMIGSFDKALERTEDYKKEITPTLKTLAKKLKARKQDEENPWYLGKNVSLNDFHLFAYLRGLKIVKNLPLPDVLTAYMQRLSQKTQIPL